MIKRCIYSWHICFILLVLFIQGIFGQRTVTFPADDGVEITADVYFQNIRYPFIILCHGLESSRGEYQLIAKKLTNLKYNCMAVDLRVGDESNFVHNETVRNLGYECNAYSASLQDIDAAIDYAYDKTKLPVILLGNNFSASLCLISAKSNKKVHAVMGFSPGEYFKDIHVAGSLTAFDKQLFLCCNKTEKPYMDSLIRHVPKSLVFRCCHEAPKANKGIELLSEKNPNHDLFWLDLLFYFNKLSQ